MSEVHLSCPLVSLGVFDTNKRVCCGFNDAYSLSPYSAPYSTRGRGSSRSRGQPYRGGSRRGGPSSSSLRMAAMDQRDHSALQRMGLPVAGISYSKSGWYKVLVSPYDVYCRWTTNVSFHENLFYNSCGLWIIYIWLTKLSQRSTTAGIYLIK